MQRSNIRLLFILICITFSQNIFSQYIPFCEKGKWGFASTDGKITINCVYDMVDFYSDDNLAKVKKGEKYGYINKEGKVVIPFEYDECYRTYEVYHSDYSIGIKIDPLIHLNKKWSPGDIINNRYIVVKNNKYGILSIKDEKPKVLVPLKYSKIQYDPEKKIFHCSTNTDKKYFDIDGKSITLEDLNAIQEIEYTDTYSGNFFKVPKVITISGKVGVIQQPPNSWDKNSYDTIIPVIYDDIITEEYDEYYVPDNPIFGVKIGNKWGIVTKKNILLPIEYDKIDIELSKDFRHWTEYKRMFVVMQNNKWGILGKKNDLTDSLTTFLPFEYDAVSNLDYSYLLVEKDNKFQVFSIDSHSLISNKSYSSITKLENQSVIGLIIFQVTNKLGQTVYIGGNGVEFFTD